MSSRRSLAAVSCLGFFLSGCVASSEAARPDITGPPSLTEPPATEPVTADRFRDLDGPIPPGAALDVSGQAPTPGTVFHYQSCTAAYSFSTPDGRTFAVTASHCGDVGDSVWAGRAGQDFVFPADPIGTIIYSDLFAADSHALDVAIIELSRPVTPSEFDAPADGPVAVAETLDVLPTQVCKDGRVTGRTCGPLTHAPAMGRLHDGDDAWQSASARARVCAKAGDSGGPVFGDIDGLRVIVGLVSGVDHALADDAPCDSADLELSFTPAADAQRLIGELVGPS